MHKLKVIKCSKSHYKPSWVIRAVDKRAADLHDEYVTKDISADHVYVENKLLSFGEVKGIVFGNFGKCSEPSHILIEVLIMSCLSTRLPAAVGILHTRLPSIKEIR